MDSLHQDLRFAIRSLRHSPTFAIIAILALALGIGANTAIFSIVNGVLLRPLPYDAAERISMIWNRWEGWPETWISEDEYWDFRNQTRAYEHVAAFTSSGRNLTGGDTPERVRAGFVTANIFPTLGASATAGRTFRDDEDRPGGDRVAVLSYGLWQRRFGGDPRIVGTTVLLNDSATTVIGVMPPRFQLPLDFGDQPMDLWLPLALDQASTGGRGGHYLNVVARLKSGANPAQGDDDVRRMARQMVAAFPQQYSPAFGSFTKPVVQEVFGSVRPALLLLSGAVGLVLLIACANVANLLLARAESRQREIAVRSALGAGRGRIARQLLTESVLLSLAGGTLGTLIGVAAVRALVATAQGKIPRLEDVSTDWRVLAFTTVVSLATGLLFGLVPAIAAARQDLQAALKEGGRGTGERARAGVRRTLVISEVALALMLVIGAGLLIRSFERLRGVDPGFEPANVLTAQISLSPARYADNDAIGAAYRQIVDRVRSVPGVERAGLVRRLPMTGTIGDWSFAIEGRASHLTGQVGNSGDWQVTGGDYFRLMGIRLIEGRLLNDADDARAVPVVVINEALAKRSWPQGGAVGARIRMGGSDTAVARTVIGIVGDVRHRGYDAEPRTELYLPHPQFAAGGGLQRNMVLTVRSANPPAALAATIRAELQQLDPDLPLSDVRTMDEVMGIWAAERRLSVVVLGTFATVALALAVVGIYGVVSYGVAQRTQEIGIRMALGAEPGRVVRQIVSQGLGMALTGIAIGLVASLAATRLMRGMLFGVSPTDPATFVTLALILAATAAFASWIPARRATKVDPTVALREA